MSIMTYTIDLTSVTTPREMHEQIKAALSLPEYYGMNLDALWDCLTAFVALPCSICLVGREHVPASLAPRVAALPLAYPARRSLTCFAARLAPLAEDTRGGDP